MSSLFRLLAFSLPSLVVAQAFGGECMAVVRPGINCAGAVDGGSN